MTPKSGEVSAEADNGVIGTGVLDRPFVIIYLQVVVAKALTLET